MPNEKKPISKRCTWYDFVYIMFLKWQNYSDEQLVSCCQRLGSGRRVWLLRSNTKECLDADERVVYPNCNRDCVKMVKQIYPCDKISKNYTQKTKERKKKSTFNSCWNLYKAWTWGKSSYQCWILGFGQVLCLYKIWSLGEPELRYAGTLSAILQLLEGNIFQNKKLQLKK